MLRFARQLLVASLVALHATVMLCGPCLHGLAGGDHGIGFSRQADADHVRDPVNAAQVLTHDCPVCHFLAQAQLPVDLVAMPSVQHICVLRPERSRTTIPPIRLCASSPRAPPACSAGLS